MKYASKIIYAPEVFWGSYLPLKYVWESYLPFTVKISTVKYETVYILQGLIWPLIHTFGEDMTICVYFMGKYDV